MDVEVPDQSLQGFEQQNRDQRADVDIAQIGNEAANRPKDRGRHPIEEVHHRPDQPVAGVDDAEGRQRAQDSGKNDGPDVEADDLLYKPDDCAQERLGGIHVVSVPPVRPAATRGAYRARQAGATDPR